MEFYLDEKQRQRRRRLLKFKIYGTLFILLLLFGGAVYLTFETPVFKIKNVTFETLSAGAPEPLTAQVIDSLTKDFKSFFTQHSILNSLLGGDNIIVWNEKAISDDYFLKNYPQIAGVKIEKDYIERQVKVSLNKRQKLGIWCPESQINLGIATPTSTEDTSNISENQPDNQRESVSINCMWFDKDGVVFEKAPAAEGNLIYRINDYSGRTISIGDNILEEKYLENLFKIFAVLEKSGLKMKSLSLSSPEFREITVDSLPGFSPKIYFSLKVDPNFGLAALTSFKNIDLDTIEYIDLRVPNRAYYKLK